MLRVGFIGVPGAGKTSTARGLAALCRRNDKLSKVELVSEYARRYITKQGPIDTITDQFRIIEKQLEWEESIAPETDLMITDSPIHLGFLYALELRKLDNPKDIMYLNDIFKKMNKINQPQRYDIIFHLPPVIKPVDDGIRTKEQLDDNWREEADNQLKFIFKLFPPKEFITVQGIDILKRIDECLMQILRIL